MTGYLFTRFIGMIVVLFLVSVGTFVLIHLAPGGPTVMVNPDLSKEDMLRIQHNLGLDQPLHIQYVRWLSTLVRGDMGYSLNFGGKVFSMIVDRLPNTIYLGLVAFLFSAFMGIFLGIVSAVKTDSTLDFCVTSTAFIGLSLPPFWFGLMLILFFSVFLQILPSSGMFPTDGSTGIWAMAKHFLMPVIVLGLLNLAEITRYTRSAMLDALASDYIRTAKAKGLGFSRILIVHALKNCLLPVLTLLGIILPRLLSGTVVTETVFGWPGIGRLAVQAAQTRDYPLVMGLTLTASLMVIFTNFTVDFLYGVVDPRVRRESAG